MEKDHLPPSKIIKGLIIIMSALVIVSLPGVAGAYVLSRMGLPPYYSILVSTYFIYTFVFFLSAFISIDSKGFVKMLELILIFFSYIIITGFYFTLFLLAVDLNSSIFLWFIIIIESFSHLIFSFIRSFNYWWQPWFW